MTIMTRRTPDARSAAEKAFKAVTTKPVEGPPKPAPSVPGVKETVSLGIDRDVLDFFKPTGPAGRTASTRHCAKPPGSNRLCPLDARGITAGRREVGMQIGGAWIGEKALDDAFKFTAVNELTTDHHGVVIEGTDASMRLCNCSGTVSTASNISSPRRT